MFGHHSLVHYLSKPGFGRGAFAEIAATETNECDWFTIEVGLGVAVVLVTL